MFKRNGTYYLQWSEGDTRNATYRSPTARRRRRPGPFRRLGVILRKLHARNPGTGRQHRPRDPGARRVLHRLPPLQDPGRRRDAPRDLHRSDVLQQRRNDCPRHADLERAANGGRAMTVARGAITRPKRPPLAPALGEPQVDDDVAARGVRVRADVVRRPQQRLPLRARQLRRLRDELDGDAVRRAAVADVTCAVIVTGPVLTFCGEPRARTRCRTGRAAGREQLLRVGPRRPTAPHLLRRHHRQVRECPSSLLIRPDRVPVSSPRGGEPL